MIAAQKVMTPLDWAGQFNSSPVNRRRQLLAFQTQLLSALPSVEIRLGDEQGHEAEDCYQQYFHAVKRAYLLPGLLRSYL
jgi:hypothetical protein